MGTVELHYSGVVIHETIKETESVVKSLSKSVDNCNQSLPQGFQELDEHTHVLENKDDFNNHLSNVLRISEEDYKKPPERNLRNVNCFKCDRKFQYTNKMRIHALTHFGHLYNVLPNKKPFSCPICRQVSSKRSILLQHYALGHRKVLQLTDTAPEDWKFGERKREEVPLNTK